MNVMMRLIQKNNIQPADVQKIDGGTNHNMPNALIHHHPQTGLQAKFSMEFCMAVLLLERKATLAEFTDDYVKRPEVQEMIRRVNFYMDPVAQNAGFNKMTSLITIHLPARQTLNDP